MAAAYKDWKAVKARSFSLFLWIRIRPGMENDISARRRSRKSFVPR